MNSIDKITKNKKCAEIKVITENILKQEASNLDQYFIETMISELTNQNLIANRKTPQGLDFFWRYLSISPEQEEVLSSRVYGRCNNISSQPIEIDSVPHETIPKIAPDLRRLEINESQTDFPEICHGSNSINKEKILSKYVRIESDL